MSTIDYVTSSSALAQTESLCDHLICNFDKTSINTLASQLTTTEKTPIGKFIFSLYYDEFQRIISY